MPVLETEILGSKIEIHYQKGEKEKLINLIDNFKNRLLEFKDLQGKITDNKILFFAALKAEDIIVDLNEKFLLQDKQKELYGNKSLELDNKVKEIINLKDNILELSKDNKKLKDLNQTFLNEIDKSNVKLSSLIKKILFKNNDHN